MQNRYHIQSLELTNFKKYGSGKFTFGPGLNIITGQNGVGKTSILDGIRLLVFGKVYFAPSDKSCISHNENFMRASARLNDYKGESYKLVAKIQESKTKVLEIDDKKITRLSNYVGTFLSVCISPDDIILVNGQSSDRREFMDQAIVQIDKTYTQYLITYNKTVKQRNALLKRFLKDNTFDASMLMAYEKKMIELAPYIHEKRKEFTDEFGVYFQRVYKEISPDQEEVILDYDSKLELKSMAELLEEYRMKDRMSGRSNVGIHKDELSMVLNDNSIKTYGSQGQIKSYVFALKIALFEYFLNKTEKLPILLLDDMFDKLDKSRVEKILNQLNQKWGGQVFITDTDKDRITKFVVDGGKQCKHIHILEDQTIDYLDV